jgi:hypothetical protein
MGLQTILIKQDQLTRNTIIGGNIDPDRYLQAIKACQNLLIKPLLGTELYNKIVADYETNSLSGLYLELFDDYVSEMIIHGSAEIYLSQGAYMITNNGITKGKTDNADSVTKEEVDYLVQASRKLYKLYEEQFLDWIKVNTIVEYNKPCGVKYKTYGSWFIKKGKNY